MQYTEEDLWKLTPRKFRSQLDVHHDIQRQMNGHASTRSNTEKVDYIDKIPGW